jgi:hypothetical protein
MNFLKTKLSKLSEGKTKESRFSNKTGKKGFQGFLGYAKFLKFRKFIKFIKSENWKVENFTNSKLQITNSKSEKPSQPPFMKGRGSVDENFSEKSSYLNGSSPFREGGPRGFLNDEKSTIISQQSTKKSLNRFLQITNYPPSLRFREAGKLQITVALLLVLLPATFFFLQNSTPDSNNPSTVSSINSEEQFEIKKTKDSLSLTSENSSITLNQIKTEKKTLKSILNLLELTTFKPK